MIKDHNYQVGDIVRLRKQHPCGGDVWKVVRIGADFRIKCETCGRSLMLPRKKFERGVKEIISECGQLTDDSWPRKFRV